MRLLKNSGSEESTPSKTAAELLRHRVPSKQDLARRIYAAALRAGKLERPSSCSECGIKCRPHGHHENYDEPLVVVWLCPPCHRKRHHQRTSEPRTAKVQIWATKEEIDSWRFLAARDGISLSEWMRRAINEGIAQRLSEQVQGSAEKREILKVQRDELATLLQRAINLVAESAPLDTRTN